jgi:hypothetical protein
MPRALESIKGVKQDFMGVCSFNLRSNPVDELMSRPRG